MAELLSSLGGRFACRQFKSQPVTEAELGLVLEAGCIAPSAFGIEPWRFIVAQTAPAKDKVAAACFNQSPAATAPVMIAIVARVEAAAPGTAFSEARLLCPALHLTHGDKGYRLHLRRPSPQSPRRATQS